MVRNSVLLYHKLYHRDDAKGTERRLETEYRKLPACIGDSPAENAEHTKDKRALMFD